MTDSCDRNIDPLLARAKTGAWKEDGIYSVITAEMKIIFVKITVTISE